jgi:hypothetical protein
MLRWEINRESSLSDGDLEEGAKRNNPATDLDTHVERKKDLYVRGKVTLEEGVVPMRAKSTKPRVKRGDGNRVPKAKKSHKKKAKDDEADGSWEKYEPAAVPKTVDADTQLAGDG